MPKHNAENIRARHEYAKYLRDAQGASQQSVDKAMKAIARFEEMTGYRSFKKLHREQIMAFKQRLYATAGKASGQLLSASTISSTLRSLRDFFRWLCREPGYRNKIAYSDADYFNPSERHLELARAKRSNPAPTLEQIQQVIRLMPTETVLDRRDRALIAFALLTGARDGALASFQLKHVHIERRLVVQDAREVRTKRSKTIFTYFMPVGDEASQIISDWITELREFHLWGADDPLFPKTLVGLDENGNFASVGISREFWTDSQPVRTIFRKAFEGAGLPYFNPHSFRSTLAQLGMKICRTPEELKAWSMNLGHSQVMTTLTSYGELPPFRHEELMRKIGSSADEPSWEGDHLRKVVEQVIEAQRRSLP